MKKQIFTIHGGDAFSTYEEYLGFLKTRSIDIERFRGTDWKSTLGTALGEEYDVFSPRMPNAQNAKYIEWKIWFERMIPFMLEPVVLIGHSFGGVFVAKYLSENEIPTTIQSTLLVAAPYDTDGGRAVMEFDLPASLELLEKQGGKIFLYHSKDDPVVSFSELAKYERALPNAKIRVFEDRGHFDQPEFSELVGDIKAL